MMSVTSAAMHRKKLAVTFLRFILLFTVVFFGSAKRLQALSSSFTSTSDWTSGISNNLDATVNDGDLKLSANGTLGARNWRTPDLALTVGSSTVSDGTNIFLSRGQGDVLFWKYSPVTDDWTTLADMPYGAYAGADLETLNGYVYVLFGGFQKAFGRYSIANNSWEILANVPDLVSSGGSMATDGTNIYVLRGYNSQDFYKFDVSSNTWTPLAGAPGSIAAGADLARVGNYLYTPRGAGTNTFYRYSLTLGTWSTQAILPGTVGEETDIATDGSFLYVPRQGATNTFYKYNIATNVWTTLTTLPGLTRYGSAVYHSQDGFVYVFQGNSTYNFWKYKTSTDTFEGPADMPLGISTGSDMVFYNNKLYTPRGSGTVTMYAYDQATGVWATLANAPATLADDTKGIAAGAYIYYFRGSGLASLYRYDPALNVWATMTDAPAIVRYGGTLAYPGSGDFIYATRGATTATFWRYSISGNSWDDVSVADLPVDAEASVGARLISDGTNVYYVAGFGIKRFFKYTISTNTWSEMAAPPFAPYYGTDIAYYNGKFIAIAGWYKNDVWEYLIATNTWRKLQSLPGYLAQNVGPYAGASIESNGAGTMYISKANSTPFILTYDVTASNFKPSGSWISATQDLGYVSSWTSLTANVTTPADSTISFETRSSSDNVSWSGWQAVSGETIASPTQRYLQTKVNFVASTGASESPTLHSITTSYNGDVTAPTNPTAIVAQSQDVSGVVLTTGESYNHIHPYFSWTGAADAQTSVVGYYVYFGTNNLADPITTGDYQTTSNYTVTTPVATGTYYLRITTQDTSGNFSSPETLFIYDYNGISPAQSLTLTDTASFTGTATNTNLANDQIKLASRTNGFWQQETLAAAPATLQYGAKNMAYVASSDKVYVFRGANTLTFYQYDIATDTWTTLANAPSNVYIGGGVIEGPSGYLYGLPGNNTTTFWRYSIEDNVWSDVDAADLPLTSYYGTTPVYDGSQFIYVARGNNDDSFWRYDTLNDTWESLANTNFGAVTNAATNVLYVGGDLTIDVANQLVYAIQGGLYDGFAVYDINTNLWTTLPDVPALPYLDSNIEYVSAANAVFFTPAYSSDKMFKYDIATQTWSQVAETPAALNYGSAMRNVGGYLYLLQGNNTTSMFKYNVAKNSWTISNRGLFGEEFQGTSYLTAYYGADICKGPNSNYYLLRGNYADDFVSWNETTGAITRLKNAPVGAYSGTSLVYAANLNQIYLTGGINVRKFYVYDITANNWTDITTDPPPADTDYGSSMVYDGVRYIYLTRGAANLTLYRYDTLGSAGSRWTTMANAPAGLGYGSEMVLKNGYIYALRGQNVANNPLYRYDIAANTWSDVAVADMSTTVYNDGFMADGGDGYLYVARGGNFNQFYRYSIAGNSWSQLGNTPASVYIGGSGEANGSNKIFMMPGPGTGAAADGIYTYVMQTDTSGFAESGSYTSQNHDLTSVYKWANLVVNYTSATNTGLSIQTRSSADGTTWSSYTAVAAAKQSGSTYTYNIKSPAARYIQVMFSLTSADGVSTGTINDYTISYYKDQSAPTNPTDTGFSAYSANAGEPLVANTWYGHSSPYFDWPEAEITDGASDTTTGSGVFGYYVYFGTNPAADPVVDGLEQINTNYTAGSLVNGSTYYLRIRAVDNAGNIATDTWQPFSYKFDAEAPDTPTGVTADPSGYTSTDSFDFAWNVATSSGALVTDYCYKTGATTGPYATDQCVTTNTISGIPSHRVGSNTFSVRAKDSAGNYSAYATTSYYFVDSGNAPAPPTNLAVSPSTSTTNLFAFSWDPPAVGTYFGSASNLSYYYSINSLPTVHSTTATSLTSLLAGAFATLPGENTFYIVTKDEAGNINYSNYASITFTANTTAPGIPLNIDIADVSVKSTNSWKLALSWEAPADGGTVSQYAIYRSIDGATFSQIATSGGISFVDVNLTQQTYYYKVKACDSTNNCGAFSSEVTLFPDGKFIVPAELIAEPIVSEITTRKATVSWSTNRTADSKIAYGTGSGNYFNEEVAKSEQLTSHKLSLQNLSPGTTYYYTAKWTDEDGNTGSAKEASFTTLPPPSTAEPVAKSIGLTSALIQFSSKNAARVRIYFGDSSAFGGIEDVVTGSGEGTHTVQLADLKDGTKYYYKINSFDTEGEEYEGEIHSFTTLQRPKISGVNVSQVKGTARSTLLLTWLSNTEISSIVTYYPVSAPGAAKDEINIALKAGKHQMILYDLAPQTSYSIIIKGKDAAGNEAVGEIQQISTSADTRPPQISDLKVEGEILGTGEEATAQLVVSYSTDEPSTAQIEFGEGSGSTYSQKTQEDGGLTSHHLVVISGLTPSKVYHLRALSKDQYANLAQSIDKVVVTPKATENALDLVVTNMSSIFGFLSGGK